MKMLAFTALLLALYPASLLACPRDADTHYVVGDHKWGTSDVTWFFVAPESEDGFTGNELEAGVIEGLTQWNGYTAFRYIYGGRVDSAPPCWDWDGRNTISFATNEGGNLAITCPHIVDGIVVEADIYLDPKWHWGVNTGRWIDIVTAVAHESGHALGLNHTNYECTRDDHPLMCKGTAYGYSWRIHPDDIAGLRAIYPPSARR